MSGKLFIFTEGGKGIGYGHLSRCTALYHEALKLGLLPVIVANKNAEGLSLLKNLHVEFEDWQSIDKIKQFKTDGCFCVIDSYIAGLEVYDYLFENSKRILIFDDENRLDYQRGIVLNMAADKAYKADESLTGTEFAIVRQAFKEKKKLTTNNKLEKLLIFLGADLYNITPVVIENISQKFPSLEIHLINTTINNNTFLKKDNIVYHSELSEHGLAALISECDAGIITASQIAIEFCCVGTPFICLKTANNQSFGWMLRSNVIYKGIEITRTDFAEEINKELLTLQAKEAREKISGIMQNTIDGEGAGRVIRRLVN